MENTEYATVVAEILARFSPSALERLDRLFSAAHSDGVSIDGMVIDVFIDQDAEGPFDVWARFEGHDAFALDRRFDDERHLFAVEWNASGWTPAVPERPEGWIRGDLEDAVTVAVTRWLEPLLPSHSPRGFWRIDAAM